MNADIARLKHRKSRKLREKDTNILTSTELPWLVARLEEISERQQQGDTNLVAERGKEKWRSAQPTRPDLSHFREPHHSYTDIFPAITVRTIDGIMLRTNFRTRCMEPQRVVWKIAPKDQYSLKELQLMASIAMEGGLSGRFLEHPFEAIQVQLDNGAV